MTFDQFLQKRIFEPLGMKDTAFFPTDDRMPRVVTLYERKPTGLSRIDTPGWLATRTLFSGGGGLWSTPEDYMQFAQMLVNSGQLNGKRLLEPAHGGLDVVEPRRRSVCEQRRPAAARAWASASPSKW